MHNINKKIPFLNFLFCLIVPFYHCHSSLTPTGPRDSSLNVSIINGATNLCTVAMAFFFFVSGYLLFLTWTWKTYPQKVKRRVFSLFIPYIVWNIIYLVVNYITGGGIAVTSETWKMFFILRVPPNAPMWYLEAIFLLAIISPFFYLLLKNRKIGWVITVGLLVFVAYSIVADPVYYQKLWGHGQIGNLFIYFPSYVFGCYFGIHSKEHENAEQVFPKLLTLVVAAFILECFVSGGFFWMIMLFSPFMLLIFLPFEKWMDDRKCYQLSFIMYGLHVPMFLIIQIPVIEWVKSVVPHASFQNLCIRSICTLAVALMSALIVFICKHFAPVVLSVLTGGRQGKSRGEKAVQKGCS